MDELEASGYFATREPFFYKPRRMHATNLVITTTTIAVDYGIFVLQCFCGGLFPWGVFILGVAMLTLLFIQYSIPVHWRMRDTFVGKSVPPRKAKRGENIVASLNRLPRNGASQSTLVIGAHHDSISLLFPPSINLLLFISNTVGILLVSALAIIDGLVSAAVSGSSPWYRAAIALLSLLTCSTLVAKLANKRTNQSDGAVDNATGCSVLLEFARKCKQMEKALYFSEIHFVFFDAEEEGLWGSSFHAAAHAHEYTRMNDNHPCFISLDEPGGPGPFVASSSFGFPLVSRPPGDKRLKMLVASLARRTGKGMETWMPYPASDHAPFVALGIPSVWLSHACINANTRNDTMDGVDETHMSSVLQALLEFVGVDKEVAASGHADT